MKKLLVISVFCIAISFISAQGAATGASADLSLDLNALSAAQLKERLEQTEATIKNLLQKSREYRRIAGGWGASAARKKRYAQLAEENSKKIKDYVKVKEAIKNRLQAVQL